MPTGRGMRQKQTKLGNGSEKLGQFTGWSLQSTTVRNLEIKDKSPYLVPSLSLAMERVVKRSDDRERPGCWQLCMFRILMVYSLQLNTRA
jgi:hypothetical protein